MMPHVVPIMLLICVFDLWACAESSRLRERRIAAAQFYGIALALALGAAVANLSGTLIPLLG